MNKKLSSFSALAVLLSQLVACSSGAPKKRIPLPDDAGAGGALDTGGAESVAGTAGKSGTGGAPSNGGASAVAGDAGAAAGGDAGAPDVAGAGGSTSGAGGSTSGTGGSSAAGAGGTGGAGGSTGGTVGVGGVTGGAGALGSGGSSGTAGTAGGPATCVAPISAITTPATAVHGDTSVAATVPTQTSVSYAWSVLSGPATITGSATQHSVTFDVGASGTEIVLQATVTNTLTACASTSSVHIPIPCAVPTLISLDRSQTPAVPQWIPSNNDSGFFDMSSASNIWAPYFSHKPASTFAIYDATFDRFSAGSWNVPANSPLFLNDTVNASILYYKVATDNAGDAVFVWTQTTDNNNYTVMVVGYHAGAATPWSTPQQVGTVFNQGTPVAVKIDRSTGVALIAWSQGPFNATIPHLRTYTVGTNTLGVDTALRATTTNKLSGDSMALALETNDSLTGFAAWYEQDTTSGLDALYALHLTNGVPDPSGTGYDIQQLALATQNFTTDIFNYNSQHNVAASNESRMVAVSASGNGAVVWPVYNGLATGTIHGELYVRRYIAGAWGAVELAASQGPSFYGPDWAIDDAGNMIVVTQTNNVGFDFLNGVKGSAWSATQRLANVNGSLAVPRIAVDSGTGKGVVTFRDQNNASRAPLRGAFYDPTTQALSPAFTIDDPQQSGGESGRVRIDSTGTATVVFPQQQKVFPQGATSANMDLLFSTTCK